MPALIAVLWGAIVSLFKYLFDKIVFSGARFYVFLAFWTLLYYTVVAQTTSWINELLRDQAVFANEWWLLGISLLPRNAFFCLALICNAYSLFWILIFKRQMSAKYKQSIDSK